MRCRSLLLVLLLAACGGGNSTPTDGGGCAPGTEGGACASNRCGKSGQGEQLLCQGGVCQQMACLPGESGCVCKSGSSCAAGNACQNGFCIAAGCTPSAKACTCLAGTCELGLSCL